MSHRQNSAARWAVVAIPCATVGWASVQAQENTLEEVIVTSQKREQRLEDVPVPVTVVGAAALAERGEYRVQDYFTEVAGLQMTPNQLGGTSTIAIRGVTSGDFAAPTVGITVDDLPFGSSTLLGGGFLMPDLDPSDLARIEVLRGPQGTLYGASSIGGLLKYVTHDPSTDRIFGRLQAGVADVQGSSEQGYSVGGAINLPLSDTLAMRASAFTRRDSGYIDNIGHVEPGERDANRTDVKGVHLSALWRPSERFSLKLSALAQDNRIDGSPFVTLAAGVGDLEQRFLPGTGLTDRKFQAYSAIATARFGAVEVTSLTGFSRNELEDSYDVTEPESELTVLAFPESEGFTENVDFTSTEKFTQELRLFVPFGSRVDWLIGAFYTQEKSPWLEEYQATDSSGDTLATFARFDFWSKYRDLAAFTNLTFHVTDRFDLQVGGRVSRIKQEFGEVDSGPFVELLFGEGFDVLEYPQTTLTETATTYLFTPQLRLTDDVMVYARLASGYRPGGVNAQGSLVGLAPTFKPDETRNYELGVKANFLEDRLYVEGSVYYIDWQDVQIQLSNDSGLSFFANGGKARSEGVELTAQASLAAFTLSGWVSWNHPVLAEDLPPNSIVSGADGDRLPYTSRISASVSLEYEFPVGPYKGSVGGDYSYVGDRLGNFVPAAEREKYPGYAKADLRADLQVNDWGVGLYVNNVADKRGILGGGRGTFISTTAFTVIQPRTVGLTVSRAF